VAKNLSPDDIVRLWAERGAASARAVQAGVNAVTESPGQKAAAQADQWVQKVAQAKQKFIDRVSSVSLADWKASMLGKGLTNMQNGYNDAQNQRKFLNFMRFFLPYVREGAARVRAMPRGNLQMAIARAEAMIRHNAAFPASTRIAPMPRPVG
jgi:hypothetical protein